MAYIEARTRQGKKGPLTYYYLIEGYREDGKVKHRQKYLGKYPNQIKYEISPDQATIITKILNEDDLQSENTKKKLEEMEIPVPSGKINEIRLVFTPPSTKPVIHIYSA